MTLSRCHVFSRRAPDFPYGVCGRSGKGSFKIRRTSEWQVTSLWCHLVPSCWTALLGLMAAAAHSFMLILATLFSSTGLSFSLLYSFLTLAPPPSGVPCPGSTPPSPHSQLAFALLIVMTPSQENQYVPAPFPGLQCLTMMVPPLVGMSPGSLGSVGSLFHHSRLKNNLCADAIVQINR